ncbi:phage baseplate assembly protein V [Rhodococcus wratislaviensis]|nr:phage baseplate assembly protein V [Rhodococcus wratislaviensis]
MDGVVVGLVASLDDPQSQGRIKLRFPWLAEDGADSGWAPIVNPMAGKERGFYYMPEVDDEVLVAFEHGDINHPFVVGFLHNGVDLPPFDGIDAHVRRVRTVSGHMLEFDDRSGQESVRLSTNSGHQLEMRDPEGFVELVTNAGQKIRLQDTPGQISLSTVTGVTVTISDAGGVSVMAPVGAVSVTSLNATVNATASAAVNATAVTLNTPLLTVNSGLAVFSGVVQCQTLVSTAVASLSYTPGAGNLL